MPSRTAVPPALIMAGVPQQNAAVYHRIRFSVVDLVVYLEVTGGDGGRASTLILRDIEMERARKHARVDRVACPADFAPEGGLSGDREIATAQAAAECLRRAGVKAAIGDRSLPLVFTEFLLRAGIGVRCDPDLGIIQRRQKDAAEIAALREAQHATEEIMALSCELIAKAPARADGVLLHEGRPLTSERVRAFIGHWLVDHGYSNTPAIVAGGPPAADCHYDGEGELRTAEPVIIDIFPRNLQSLYHGDCTRTVVHGDVPDRVAAMHAAACAGKHAAAAAIQAGVTGEAVHKATTDSVRQSGYSVGLPPDGAALSYCAITHGTGHGVGLDVHEPPLLDVKGPELLLGDVVTIEPGLYCREVGGVRVEDMVVVTRDGCDNLNRLPEGLRWA
jgi:Xaa-Pro aminopeptidase